MPHYSKNRLIQLAAPLFFAPGVLFAEANRHSWTLPGGDTVTGTIESAGARGVLVKREDGHTKMVSRQTMTKSDRALLDDWRRYGNPTEEPGLGKEDPLHSRRFADYAKARLLAATLAMRERRSS